MLKLIRNPELKWEFISMDFIPRFLKTVRQHDSIMVVVDMLTKVVHLIPVKSTFSTSDIVQVFIVEKCATRNVKFRKC